MLYLPLVDRAINHTSLSILGKRDSRELSGIRRDIITRGTGKVSEVSWLERPTLVSNRQSHDGMLMLTLNTAHDVAEDMLDAGMASVTMVQRSRTC